MKENSSFATMLGYWAQAQADETAVTFLDHRTSADGHAISLTWRELDERVTAVALHARELAAPGDRAAVLVAQSVDYVVAFLGAIRAGLVAVPLFAPSLPGHGDRLTAVLDDCEPALVLTTDDERDDVKGLVSGPKILVVDTIPAEPGEHEWPDPEPDDLAYLQYTSGSTRAPAGVMLTHHNVVTNARQALRAYGGERGTTSAVSWLPLFHDMGLILGIGAPVVGGLTSVLMDPLAFLERPGRWLRALSASPGAISAAPNFAYAYSASRVSEREKSYLELSRVVSLINGSEPVLPSTVAKFQESFAECGLQPEVHRASYGLAEATVLVSVTDAGQPSRQVTFDRDRLAAGTAVPAAGGATTTLVSCGRAVDQEIRIVDPGGAVVPDGTVGEIWVHGPNVGQGYWNRPDSVFGRSLPGAGGDWLATGDLGVVFEGELFMTGRLKDLIIVDGRNHYPQDVEQTVEAHPVVRPHSAAAFSVPGEDGEVAVVVLERARQAEADFDEVAAWLRAEVSAVHGLRLREVVFTEPGEVPRTSSGKISRALCRRRYLDGSLDARRLA
ncbi:fatty acyl-AMP ligase [Amycolatopsis endophytica]|uniref:Acyl-CoA synthetase (AMP-forming)/AMP-acid ligase II n=1 Tax=Amycolatopsis endophytica TaxID=860233 RepID=A0A853B3W0_9PSEU|nr:fatty acyl-AMP ligase [Amycolatopsis endophytica]NYI89494.1 acyl-CoA synthetase (AMP-forming)/AMP-acid ligase II [Amycolatopsis endophytica]